VIISKNTFNLDLRTITRTGHNFNLLQAFRLLYLLTSQNFMCCSSSHFVYHSSLSLCVFLMIYLFSTTHIQSKRESYLKCLTVSLSFYDDDDSQSPLFRRPSSFSFSTYRYKRNENVCIYI
jgi:hypothetical protein